MVASDAPRFRDSAVVVLVRGHGQDLETFWVKRSDEVAVMPGFQAFPGGKVSAEDSELEFEDAADLPDRALRACALREAFEETGVLAGLAAPVAIDALETARQRLLAEETSFPALQRERGWRFRAGALAYAGRWQTPPFATTRFDATYYLVRVPEGQSPSIRVGELASGEWTTPAAAMERYRRGEVAFAAPILWTLDALAAGEDGLAERLARGPERAATPVQRSERKWGIVLHPMKTRPLPPATHTNAYLIGEREMALIDPGSGEPAALEKLFALIDSLGAEGRRLAIVLASHHHPDHVGGVDGVRERYRVPVGAHRQTAVQMRVDRVLDDGERIALEPGAGEWSLRAIHTPGHARGHLCFIHPRTGSLFCGDHIPGGAGTVIIDPPEGNMAAYVRSLERLRDEPIETLFPGHGSPQGAARRRIEWLISHRRKREALVLAALGEAPEALDALVARAYRDTPTELWGYAERSLLAHLEKLEAEGRAARAGERWRRLAPDDD